MFFFFMGTKYSKTLGLEEVLRIFEWFVEIIHTVIQPRKLRMSFFLVSTQMMPINDLMVEEDRNQFVPLIGRAQSEGSIDSSVTAKLITP